MKERPFFTAALVFSSPSLVPSLAAFTSFCIFWRHKIKTFTVQKESRKFSILWLKRLSYAGRGTALEEGWRHTTGHVIQESRAGTSAESATMLTDTMTDLHHSRHRTVSQPPMHTCIMRQASAADRKCKWTGWKTHRQYHHHHHHHHRSFTSEQDEGAESARRPECLTRRRVKGWDYVV